MSNPASIKDDIHEFTKSFKSNSCASKISSGLPHYVSGSHAEGIRLMPLRISSWFLSSDPRRLGKAMARVGWIGFWAQLAMLAVVSVTLLVLFFGEDSEEVLSVESWGRLEVQVGLGLLILISTTLWSLRYVQLGRRLADAAPGHSVLAKLMSTTWVGVFLSSLGILLSLAILIETALLLFLELASTPAAPVIPPAGSNAMAGVSAIQIAELFIDLILLTGEVLILNLSIYLLFRFQVVELVERRDSDKSTVHDLEEPG